MGHWQVTLSQRKILVLATDSLPETGNKNPLYVNLPPEMLEIELSEARKQ